jgi:hypothetical protein
VCNLQDELFSVLLLLFKIHLIWTTFRELALFTALGYRSWFWVYLWSLQGKGNVHWTYWHSDSVALHSFNADKTYQEFV